MSLLVFVVVLAVSGIMLNHGDSLGLDRRFVNWSWVLDAYGVEMPALSASYADEGHRATLVGERLFVDGHDVEQRMSALAGFAVLDPLVFAAGEKSVRVLTVEGDLVEVIELAGLPGPIEQVGRAGGRAVLRSGDTVLRSDEDIAVFEPWSDPLPDDILWSVATPPGADELASLERAYRGRGLSLERVLLDLHSGRIVGLAGTLFMDLVGIFLIVLGISGLVISKSRSRNGIVARTNSAERDN